MRRGTLMWAAAAVLSLGAGAWGQVEPGMAPADPGAEHEDKAKSDPAGAMRDADAAFSKLTSLSFKVHASGIGGLATRSPIVDATVKMARADAGGDRRDFEWNFLIRGTARKADQADGAPFATWFDGTAVRTMREQDKTVLESAWDNREEPMAVGAQWALTWAVRWKELVSGPFGDTETHPKCRYEGDALVEGVPCRVMYTDYSELSDPRLMDAWWYLGKADSLPRRVEMHYIDTGEGDAYGVATLTQMEPGVEVKADQLAMAVPEGFEVKKAKEPEGRRARRTASAPDDQPAAGPQVGQAAPEWTLKDASGKEHTLSALKGKVVVLDFWATWCPPCRMAMPGIQKIHEKYLGKPVEVIGMNMSENADPVAYMKKQGFTYGLLLNAETIADKYGISGIPAIFVVGKDGKVLLTQVGYSDELDAAIEKAVEEGLKK